MRGFIVNKFRGDASLLEPAHHYIEELTGKPVSVVKEGEVKMLLQGGDLTQFCPRYIPFCSLGCETGVLLALKGSSGRQEAEDGKRAIELCGGRVEQIHDYALPNGDPRTLVIVRKISQTPPKYPRNAGQISKRPL